jgi:hypothetical protein
MSHLQSLSIAARLWAWAAVLRILKRTVPFEALVRLVHRRPGVLRSSPDFERQLETFMDRKGRFPFRPPANCLERSLGAYRMLCAAKASPELVVGIRRIEGRRVEGHVWVTAHGRSLAERDADLATYTAVARFDGDGHRHPKTQSAADLARIPLR